MISKANFLLWLLSVEYDITMSKNPWGCNFAHRDEKKSMVIAAVQDNGHAKTIGALPGARIFAINDKSLRSLKVKSSGHISSILKKVELPFTLSLQIVATAAPTKLAITGLSKFKQYQEYQKKKKYRLRGRSSETAKAHRG
eukprot:TRINITY_DN4177_c0_g1_i1.p1 TRINITY_DN4177_c0_g1~~TRINITY_DN4177_c0_g1_i1.p1  ORF type:complete len:141 (+),score=39.35 TRINITY_DN4177_c0_g1_i1:22-444(+)